MRKWFLDETSVNLLRNRGASKDKAVEAFAFEMQPYHYPTGGFKCS